MRGLLGLAEGSANPAGMKATAEWFPARERGLAGGVFNSGGTLVVTHCTFANNSAAAPGGAIYNEGELTVRVGFRVSPASEDTVNMNRRTFGRFFLVFSAASGSGRATMTAINLARIMAFLRANGCDIPDMGVDLADYFGPNAKVAVNGNEVYGLLEDSPDRDTPSIRRQNFIGFTEITDLADDIELPSSIFQVIFNKALAYIAYKQGDGTNIASVSKDDINYLIQTIM